MKQEYIQQQKNLYTAHTSTGSLLTDAEYLFSFWTYMNVIASRKQESTLLQYDDTTIKLRNISSPYNQTSLAFFEW